MSLSRKLYVVDVEDFSYRWNYCKSSQAFLKGEKANKKIVYEAIKAIGCEREPCEYLPTQQQIKEAAREIRKGWSGEGKGRGNFR